MSKQRHIFTVLIDGKPHNQAFTSLSALCRQFKLSYRVADKLLEINNTFKMATETRDIITITKATLILNGNSANNSIHNKALS